MTVVVLQPAAGIDTYIYSGNPTYNYGTSFPIKAGKQTTAITRALLKFDLSSLPYAAIINSATLELYVDDERTTDDRDVGVHRALTEWFEGAKNGAAPDASTDGSTWNLRNANGSVAWGAAGGQSSTDYAAVATDTTTITERDVWASWDVTADVVAWMAGTADNHGWWFINTNESTRNTEKLFSCSDGLEAEYPKLTIDYDEPVYGGSASLTNVLRYLTGRL